MSWRTQIFRNFHQRKQEKTKHLFFFLVCMYMQVTSLNFETTACTHAYFKEVLLCDPEGNNCFDFKARAIIPLWKTTHTWYKNYKEPLSTACFITMKHQSVIDSLLTVKMFSVMEPFFVSMWIQNNVFSKSLNLLHKLTFYSFWDQAIINITEQTYKTAIFEEHSNKHGQKFKSTNLTNTTS